MLESWRARFKGQTGWRLFTTIAMVLVAVGLLGYLLYRERDVLLSYPWQVRPLPLLAAFGLFSLALSLAALVWTWIMRNLGAQVDIWRHASYYCISMLVRRLPGTLWYVAYLSKMYQGEGFSPWLTTLASGYELVVSVISGILVSLLAAAEILGRYPQGGFIVAGLALACLAFLHPRFIRWVLRRSGSQAAPPPLASLARWLGVYLLIRLVSGLIVYCVIDSLYPLTLDTLPYLTGVWSAVNVLSTLLLFSLSNLGITELSLSLLFSPILPSSIAVVIAVGLRFLFILFELLDALLVIGLNAVLRKTR